MRSFLFSLLAGLAALHSHAAPAPDDPPLAFRAGSVNLGVLKTLDPIAHEAVLFNSTGEPITVTGVKTSCGCTKASVEPSTVPARGEALLRFKLNPQIRGRYVQVMVEYQWSGAKRMSALQVEYSLKLAGDVRADPPFSEVLIDPERSEADPGVRIRVTKHIGKPEMNLGDIRVTSCPAWLRLVSSAPAPRMYRNKDDASSQPVKSLSEIPRKEVYELEGTVDTAAALREAGAGRKSVHGVVRMQTGFHHPFDEWDYPVQVSFSPRIEVTPRRLVIRKNEPQPAARIVKFRGSAVEGLSAENVVADSGTPFLRCEVIPGNSSWKLKVTTEEHNWSSESSGEITVKARDGSPIATIPWQMLNGR